MDGPTQAFRWVSLLGTDAGNAIEAGSTQPRWHSFLALWARGKASTEEKSLLLCSVLLGYSLDAWCCLGSDAKGKPHSWVMVRDRGDASLPSEVTCWDPRAALPFTADEPRYLASYSSIDTVFNHRRVLICHADAAARVTFDFTDPRAWLSAPLAAEAVDILRLQPAAGQFSDLRPKSWGLPAETEVIEEAIEMRLAAAIKAHREAAGLPTATDPHLAQLLHVALANCELERQGLPSQAASFEVMARRACAVGEVLTAVPVQFNHLKVSLYWPALSDRQTVREVLAAPAGTSFAVRARVVLYPEGCVAVWVLVAGRGKF